MYTIARFCKNTDETEAQWKVVKANIIKYLTIKLREKNISVILNNKEEKNVIELYCENLNIKIKFMTGTITEESEEDNLLMIKYNNNVCKVVPIYNISEDFYNFIK
tara:strand:+ start:2329 stop:2646 length:318 start_codon:yes stop_codon:yes gene_type:complete